MRVRSSIVYFFSALLALNSSAQSCRVDAQETDKPSTATWWNPTTWGSESSDSGVRKSSYFNGGAKTESSDKPLFSLPSLPWSTTESTTPTSPTAPTVTATPSSSPTMLGKLRQSTRQAWYSTTDFLNPFNDAPEKPKEYIPQQQGYQPQNLNKTTTSGSGPFGWLWREERTEQPATVNGFLQQPRPRF